VAEIVQALGGDFVPQQAGKQVGPEQVIAANPEVIILSWAGMERIDAGRVREHPGWDRIDAVREGRIAPVDEIMLNAPGPNLKQGMREIWHALYPDED
jgi:iron complex transport system substrate-binding protein